MRKLLLLLPLLLFLSYLPANAQNSDINYPGNLLTSACTNANTNCGNQVILPLSAPATGSTAEISTRNYTVASVTVRGTYAGATINFEFSDDGGVTYFQNLCTRTDSNIQESSEALPSNQVRAWDCGVSGSTNFRVRLSAIGSGTMNTGLTLSTAAIEPAPTVALTNTPGTTDPCQTPSVLKTSTFPANITTATTTSIVAASGTTAIYLCGFQITSFDTTTANTFQLEYGTGAACVTTQVPITPVYTSPILVAGNAPYVMTVGFSGASAVKPSAAGSALCLVSTVGSTPVIQALVTYVQQ